MLVLTRQKDESIMIGDDVEIVVVDVSPGGRVRLGISAPDSVAVHRKEVYGALKRSQLTDGPVRSLAERVQITAEDVGSVEDVLGKQE